MNPRIILLLLCFAILSSCGTDTSEGVTLNSHNDGESVDANTITLSGSAGNSTTVYVGVGNPPKFQSANIVSNVWALKLKLAFGENTVHFYGSSKVSNVIRITATNAMRVNCTALSRQEKLQLLIGTWEEQMGTQLIFYANGKMNEVTTLGNNQFDWSLAEDDVTIWAGLYGDHTSSYKITKITKDALEVDAEVLDSKMHFSYKRLK